MRLQSYTLKTILLTLALVSGSHLLYSQTVSGVSDISTGYFNGHAYASYGSFSSGKSTIQGELAGNPFTITFPELGALDDRDTIHNYYPALPANAGMSPHVQLDVNSVSSGSVYKIDFTNNLQPLDQLIIVDLDYSARVKVSFYDEHGTKLNIDGNVKLVSLSDVSGRPAPISMYTDEIGLNGDIPYVTLGQDDQGFAMVMLKNNVRRIEIVQGFNSTSGTWTFTFTCGKPDRGDAPASYGDAQHLPLKRLKIGTIAPDADTTVQYSTYAIADNMITGTTVINDEDGLPVVPPLSNTGALVQPGLSYSFTVPVSNSTGKEGKIIAWIDWNGNGQFDATEGISLQVPTGAVNLNSTFTWTNATLTREAGVPGTYLRLRVTTDPSVTVSTPTGFAADGEAEDYFIPFTVILPVNFTNFTAAKQNETVLLNWTTEGTDNIKGFEVQRKTGYDNNWENIGFIAGSAFNNSNGLSSTYSFTDRRPVAGVNSYRLKQIDADNSAIFSSIASVRMAEEKSVIAVYPNPASDFVTVTHNFDNKPATIAVLNANGQRLYVPKTISGNRITLNTQSLEAGVYILQIQDGKTVTSHQFVISR